MVEVSNKPENKRHYAGLDGLRAIAVLMVFSQHYFEYPEQYRWGWIGVRIFFVLSGFLITGILYDTREARNRYRAFYARRALRIFPLYFAVLAIGWALWPIFRWSFTQPGRLPRSISPITAALFGSTTSLASTDWNI